MLILAGPEGHLGKATVRIVVDGASEGFVGDGAMALAQQVVDVIDQQKAQFRTLYDDDMGLWDKVLHIARTIYGANNLIADKKVRAQFTRMEKLGYGHFPVCMAKTQYSFSTDQIARDQLAPFQQRFQNWCL